MDEKQAKLSQLWSVENNLWEAEDRILAMEVAFNVLLRTLQESGSLEPDRFQRHLSRATNELDEQAGTELQGAVRALDALRQHVGVLLTQQHRQSRSS